MFNSKASVSEKSKDIAVELFAKDKVGEYSLDEVYSYFKAHIFEAKDSRLVNFYNKIATKNFL